MDAHNPSRGEAAAREEQSKPSKEEANAEAASKAQAAAQTKRSYSAFSSGLYVHPRVAKTRAGEQPSQSCHLKP
jgi:hypothetical protein